MNRMLRTPGERWSSQDLKIEVKPCVASETCYFFKVMDLGIGWGAVTPMVLFYRVYYGHLCFKTENAKRLSI